MGIYQYKYGDRPLEGYTIQRAAGRGGFGEVYYAVSDSGRQVALKAIQSHEQVELRGISQCMNLKSPHLVTVFDVRHNDNGRPFVIMEYVSGPSLSDLLKESAGGLGVQKAAFFLREISKGLSFLHESGIIHRDLKPGNIFYENGYVKIGDYGLTKVISSNQHVSHSITVGTVHYMAPEIGAGRYDRSIDIYALGVVLYEMLTGQVPFLGASPAEVLMKHMTAMPDLTDIDDPFARVVARAMAKDPNTRYQSAQAMVEDVFGVEHIRNSVSQFSPADLTIVAKHIAQKMCNASPAGGANQGSSEQSHTAQFPQDKLAKRAWIKKIEVKKRGWFGGGAECNLQLCITHSEAKEVPIVDFLDQGFSIPDDDNWSAQCRISPDGSRVLFCTGDGLCLVNCDGSSLTQISDQMALIGEPHRAQPSWLDNDTTRVKVWHMGRQHLYRVELNRHNNVVQYCEEEPPSTSGLVSVARNRRLVDHQDARRQKLVGVGRTMNCTGSLKAEEIGKRKRFISSARTAKEREFWALFFDEIDRRAHVTADFVKDNFGVHVHSRKHLTSSGYKYSLMYTRDDSFQMNAKGYDGQRWDGLTRLKNWCITRGLPEKFYSELRARKLSEDDAWIHVPSLLKTRSASHIVDSLFACVDLFG